MTTPTESPATPTPCIGCGYELHGLATNGQCPECSTPVSDSLRGDALEHAAPQWLARIARGCWMLMAAAAVFAFGVLVPILLIVSSSPGWIRFAEALFIGLAGTGLVLLFAGLFTLTTLESRDLLLERDYSTRRLTRGSALLAIVFYTLGHSVPGTWSWLCRIGFLLTLTLALLGALRRLQHIGRRSAHGERVCEIADRCFWTCLAMGGLILAGTVVVQTTGRLVTPVRVAWLIYAICGLRSLALFGRLRTLVNQARDG